MIFLLMQATIACPDLKGANIGTRTPFVEYVSRTCLSQPLTQSRYIKFLPEENLPTFWSSDERYLLTGTTLQPAVDAKLRSLQREYENLRKATENIRWCAKYWWNSENFLLDFDDWRQVDAMYRSRALEYPGIGDAMVPCIDMANHAVGARTRALYETDGECNAILLLRDGVEVKKGEEVTITYGDDKGACEMIFSYGFIDKDMGDDAKELFLGLEMMPDDPLGAAKERVCTAAPGVKIFCKEERVEWYSEFVWLVIVNEEDGLNFEVLQTNDGNRELQVSWKGDELKNITILRSLLEKEERWEVFQLRAAAIIRERIEAQLNALNVFSQEAQTIEFGEGTGIRERPFEMAARLHELENELLWKASQRLETEVEELSKTETVRRYFAEVTGQEVDEQEEEEDLS
jgi:hypothetical protein